ncbi:MAG: UDP-2,4-diacetamido-2,4,6-trideoxy-beta-L-altropyranose hydrolase [Coriobacteriia bacterium]
MNIVFRADSSAEIGAGHVMRCLTLADELAAHGEQCIFVCREAAMDAGDRIERAGYAVVGISSVSDGAAEAAVVCEALAAAGVAQADWLVVDHYDLDRDFESGMRPQVSRIVVVDDLASRPHDCDILLDHNIGANAADYAALVSDQAVVLAGPRFALLRAQFVAASHTPRTRDWSVHRLLVSFGGTDPTNETQKAIEALMILGDSRFETDIVLPEGAPHRAAVEASAQGMPGVTLYGRVDDMAAFMGGADLMLGAGGMTLLERCALGLPSVSLVVAGNQARGTRAAALAGATVDLGDSSAVTATDIASALSQLIADPQAVRETAAAARELIGSSLGHGPKTVAGLMRCIAQEPGARLRRLRLEDRALLLRWRNSDRVRLAMSKQHIVEDDEHSAWIARALECEPPVYYIYECGGIPLGAVNFSDLDTVTAKCEWGFYIGETWAPKGSGTRMGMLALDLAFGDLRMTEVRAEVLEHNARSLAYHAKMGFKEAGIISGPSSDGGRMLKWRLMSLSAAEWAETRRELVARLAREEGNE